MGAEQYTWSVTAIVVIMGSQATKSASEGDEKFMMKFAPGSTKYLGHWRKKYDFEGKLIVGQCQMLVEQLTVEAACAKGKLKQERDLQLASAKLWLEQAQKRQVAVNAKRAALQALAVKPEDETVQSTSVVLTLRDQQRRVALEREREAREEEEKQEQEKREREEEDRVRQEFGDAAARYLSPYNTRSKTKGDETGAAGMPVYPVHAADTFPMVEVANPHFGVESDRSRVICVYRPWTESECAEACKGLGDPLTNVDEFIARHKQLCSSYRLNGQETEATFRKCLTYNWARVRGTYTGRDGNTVLPYGHENLRGQVDGVYERLRTTFKASADYNKIAQCVQKEGEDVHEFRARLEEVFKVHSGLEESAEKASTYQQQLKQATGVGR